MTHPKEGEWWCPGRFAGRTDKGDTYRGCDGDPSCEVCKGDPLSRVLEKRVESLPWSERARNSWQARALRGWANLMASRYGRPVYLVGGALRDAVPRDVDVRVVLLASEFEARFGDWRKWDHKIFDPDVVEAERRWHLEIAKMNVQGAGATHLPIDFQIQALPEAIRYDRENRQRLDDVPGLVPAWET